MIGKEKIEKRCAELDKEFESFSSIVARLNEVDAREETDRFLANFKKMRDKVYLLSKLKPSVKGSYLLLYQYYLWEFCGAKWFVKWEDFEKWPSPESVSRAFRKLVEAGKVEPTFKTRCRRSLRQQLYRENMSKV